MSLREAVETRPRGTTEILDDAWRIYFADPLFLLALTAFFYLPAVTCFVLLIADSEYSSIVWLPALTALLISLTGLASGACQEAFHSWSEDYPVSLGECLKAACQRGVFHVASQALSIVGPVAVLIFLVAPRWSVGMRVFGALGFGFLAALMALFSFTRQPSFTAGKPRFWRAVRYSIQATGQNFGRALLFLLLRGVLLLFAVFNLHLFGIFALWIAENLAGFDIAYLGIICSFNGAYLLSLVLLAWCLLAPFHEAVCYLFLVDVRARQEGLDLWQRVEELFPAKGQPAVLVPAVTPSRMRAEEVVPPVRTVSAMGIAFALFTMMLQPIRVEAQEPLNAVRAARQDINVIRDEVKSAVPFPGGDYWLPRLEKVAASLEATASKASMYRWFRLAIKSIPDLTQVETVARLDDIDAQLDLLLDSLTRPRQVARAGPTANEIKNLIPPEKRSGKSQKAQPTEAKKKVENDREPVEQGEPGRGDLGKPVGPGIVPPMGIGGFANILLIVLIGLGAAALAFGLVYIAFAWWQSRTNSKPPTSGLSPQPVDDALDDPTQQDPSRLWQQADERARAGDYLAAVRTIYLAILAILHRGGLIRYQRTRTNGEYADQLRRRQPLHHPFLRLTTVFELKWYGQRACESDDYRQCRELAEQIHAGVSSRKA